MFGCSFLSCSKPQIFQISPQFEAVLPFKNGIAAVSQNGLWGIINTEGKWVITPQYKQATLPNDAVYLLTNQANETFQVVKSALSGEWQTLPFEEKNIITNTSLGSRTLFKEGNKYGLIDEKNKLILEAVYDTITYIGEDLFIAHNNNGDQLIHASGKKLTPIYAEISPEIKFDRIRFRQNEQYGILSKDGTVILKPSWWLLEIVGRNIIACTEGGDYTLHTDQLKQLSDFKFSYITFLENGNWLARAREEGICKIFDADGKLIAEDITASDGKMMFGMLPAKINKTGWTYIDSWGKQTLPKNFDFVETFWPNGKAIFIKPNGISPNNKGLIDTLGNVVLEPIYEEISWHPDNVYTVIKDRTIQFLNAEFKPITKPSKTLIEYIRNGVYSRYKTTSSVAFQKSNWYTGDKAKIYIDRDHKLIGVYATNGELLISAKDYKEEEPLPAVSEGLVAAKKGNLWGFVKSN